MSGQAPARAAGAASGHLRGERGLLRSRQLREGPVWPVPLAVARFAEGLFEFRKAQDFSAEGSPRAWGNASLWAAAEGLGAGGRKAAAVASSVAALWWVAELAGHRGPRRTAFTQI